MALRLMMDVHIPLSIVQGLRLRNIDVLRAQEDGSAQLSDPDLLDRANELQRTLFTYDNDLLVEAHMRLTNQIQFYGVIFVHERKYAIGDSVRALINLSQKASSEDLVNHVTFL